MADQIIQILSGGQSSIAGTATEASILAQVPAIIDAQIALKSPFVNKPAQDTFKLISEAGESLFLTSAGTSPSGLGTSAFGVDAAAQNRGAYVSAFARGAAYQNAGDNTSAFGNAAAYQNRGAYVSAFGNGAAYENAGAHVSAFGNRAAFQNSYDNVSCFGASVNATGANQVQLGDAATTVYHSGIAARSDRRDKRNIVPLDAAKCVALIEQANFISHVWDKRDAYRMDQSPKDAEGNITKLIPFSQIVTDGSKAGKRAHASVVAQDLRDLIAKVGLEDSTAVVKDASFDGGEDVLSIDAQELNTIAMAALQSALKRISALELALAAK